MNILLLCVYKLRKLSRNQALHENPVSIGNYACGTSSISEFPVLFPREWRAGIVQTHKFSETTMGDKSS